MEEEIQPPLAGANSQLDAGEFAQLDSNCHQFECVAIVGGVGNALMNGCLYWLAPYAYGE